MRNAALFAAPSVIFCAGAHVHVLAMSLLLLLSPQVGGCAERSLLSFPGSSAMALLAYLKSLFILQLLMGFVFVVSGLIINLIQLCTCVLWPINKQLYRRINCRLSYSLWSREYTFLSWNTPEERPQLVDEVVWRHLRC